MILHTGGAAVPSTAARRVPTPAISLAAVILVLMAASAVFLAGAGLAAGSWQFVVAGIAQGVTTAALRPLVTS